MRLVLLANPEHPRVASLQAALHARRLAPVEVVAYATWLRQPDLLLRQLDGPCWLKLEAPGENTATQQALLEQGAAALGVATPTPPLHGEFAAIDVAFAGFAAALRALAAALTQRPWVRCVNAPADILALCDKWHCQQRLQAGGVPVPALLGPVVDFAGLVQLLQAQAARRVFLKPRFGSSAAGVVALEYDGKSRFQATTSVEMAGDRLFNSLRIRRYRGDAVAKLVDRLAADALYAERWIPKPVRGGSSFDWRVVMLGGIPRHRLARLSRSPLTNLHLGNARGEAAHYLSARAEQRLEATATQAAACFAQSGVLGVDMIVTEQRAHVLEVNAFGDWLPRLRWRDRTVHEMQVEFLQQA